MNAVVLLALTALLGCAAAVPLQQGAPRSLNRTARVDPDDAKLTVPELITKYGYPVEEHQVITEDGYILMVHRIPYGKKSGPAEGKKAVLIQHGLLSSSADWVISGPEKALAYILADRGYDVWMSNSRGNTLSRAHTHLDPEKLDFWDFSWHEMGKYDTPAVIDHILGVTGQSSLVYIGHSQGTTQFFAFGALRPEYASKVDVFIGLAPAAWMHHTVSPPLLATVLYSDVIGWVSNMMGDGEFSPSSEFLKLYGGVMCSDMFPIYQAMCANSLFIFAGYDSTQLDLDLLPVLFGHTPAGASVKQFLHYSQNIKSRQFRQYDYGLIGNEQRYGSIHPPKYDLSTIQIPVALFHSVNDWLAQPLDVKAIAEAVPNLILNQLVPHPFFNHLDFMWAIDADTLVYNSVLDILSLYS